MGYQKYDPTIHNEVQFHRLPGNITHDTLEQIKSRLYITPALPEYMRKRANDDPQRYMAFVEEAVDNYPNIRIGRNEIELD